MASNENLNIYEYGGGAGVIEHVKQYIFPPVIRDISEMSGVPLSEMQKAFASTFSKESCSSQKDSFHFKMK